MADKAAIGKLRHRITIQKLELADDGQGGSTETWRDRCYLWAEVKPVSGYEELISQSIKERRTHKIMTRYLSDLNAMTSHSDRIKFGDRIFQIKGNWKPDERNFFMSIDAIEGVET